MHEVEKRWVSIEDEELGELRLRENLGVTDGATNVAVDMAISQLMKELRGFTSMLKDNWRVIDLQTSMRFYCRLVMRFVPLVLEKQGPILRQPCNLGVRGADYPRMS